MTSQTENLPKAGERYRCEVCGMEVEVTSDCHCAEGAPRMECCEAPMKREISQ